ncbi:MAG: hypothetical protein HFI92_13680 [Lachnospiraceae bacterium]|nr:hypothetical protein [Lachnospiraceae bacterium]
MTTGLKVWLWLVLVFNAIGAVTSVAAAFLIPGMWIVVAAEVLVVAGAVMLLFPRKKMGFYLICAGAAVSLVLNIILGGNIVSSVISAVIMPLIIWLLIKNTWYEFH